MKPWNYIEKCTEANGGNRNIQSRDINGFKDLQKRYYLQRKFQACSCWHLM